MSLQLKSNTSSLFSNCKRRITAWYNGYRDDSFVVIVALDRRRHWTAATAHVVVKFWLCEWKWIIGTVIAVIGLLMAYKKLG
jgi:hypothetical protein